MIRSDYNIFEKNRRLFRKFGKEMKVINMQN